MALPDHEASMRFCSTRSVRSRFHTFALIALSLIAAGCATDPLAEQPPVATAPPPAPSPTISRPTPSPAPTATVEPIAQNPIVTQTRTLPPLRPLQDERVADQLATPRALTDGERPYRIALWSPHGPWIAAVPQDGPGLDIINSDTGAVVPVLRDAYALEPVWDVAPDGEPCLLLHRVVGEGDQLDVVCAPDWDRSTRTITTPNPIRAPALAGDRVVWSSADDLVLAAPDPQPLGLGSALAIAFHGDDLLLWTPTVDNLENVQTLVARLRAGERYAMSEHGEGLWLPRPSPDGAKLALTSIGGRIATAAIDGSARYDLGPGDGPAWSPDSRRLAYAGVSAGEAFLSRDIHVLDWQGDGQRIRLTDANDEQFYTSPSWSPDGSWIAFVEIDSGQVFVVAAP
jgi:hypothetical protein